MKHSILFALMAFINLVHAQQSNAPLNSHDDKLYTMHPRDFFITVDYRLFDNNGIAKGGRVLCKKDPISGTYTYIGNAYNNPYWATSETLRRAIMSKESKIINIILHEGRVNLNEANSDNITPLQMALWFNKPLVPLLLQCGARVHNPPYHTAYELIDGTFIDQSVSPELIEMLLSRNVVNLSKREKYWLTYNTQEAYDNQNKPATQYTIDEFARERRDRAFRVNAIVQMSIKNVSKKDRHCPE